MREGPRLPRRLASHLPWGWHRGPAAACGCHHPRLCPRRPTPASDGRPSAVPLRARPGLAGEGVGTGRSRPSPSGGTQHSRPRAVRAPCGKPGPVFSLSQNRRVEASRLGQGVAFWLERVSRCVPCERRVSVPVPLLVSPGAGAERGPVFNHITDANAPGTAGARGGDIEGSHSPVQC